MDPIPFQTDNDLMLLNECIHTYLYCTSIPFGDLSVLILNKTRFHTYIHIYVKNNCNNRIYICNEQSTSKAWQGVHLISHWDKEITQLIVSIQQKLLSS